MKKRFLSCIALLLLLSLSLTSCVKGLPGSELFFAAKDGIAEFSNNLDLLFAGDLPLVANGKSDYAVVTDKDASAHVLEAVEDLCTSIRKQTGADLRKNDAGTATKRILVSISTEDKSASNAAPAAQFHIGVEGEDVVIKAATEVMLISALSYFKEHLLTQEQDATLSLPRTLSYTPPVRLYENNQLIITRPENSSERAIQIITHLHEALYQNAGIRCSIKSDFNTTGDSVSEILIGTPNRVECDEILAQLSFDGYYIGSREQKLMILAKNDLMLELAVEKFLATFVTAANAGCNKEEKSIILPEYCDYYHKETGLLLTNEGTCHAVLVHPENISAATLAKINRFCDSFKRLTNATLEIRTDTDYQRRADVIEILLGDTNREESRRHMRGLPFEDWKILAEGRTLVVAAYEDTSLDAALDALITCLREQVQRASGSSIYYPWSNTVIPGVNRFLFLCSNITLTSKDVVTPRDGS